VGDIRETVFVERVHADHRHLPVGQPLLGGHPSWVDRAGADLELVELVRSRD